ncbi:MAG: c-type cytochrome domain-containing protein [Oligoflexia bacterium]|nr:c-type cytochrome domain-containing protein [Oligoflexia bacterium]
MKKLFFIIFPVTVAGCGPAYHDPDDAGALVEPNYKSVSTNIIQNKCVSCHNSVKKDNGIDLSSYEKIFAPEVFPPLIIPGNPEKSSLFKSVLSGKMPKDAQPLSQKQLKAIYDWIKNGAKKEEQPSKPNPPTTPEPDEPGTEEPGSGEPGNGFVKQAVITIKLYLRRYV